MKTASSAFSHTSRTHQTGAAAIELALTMPIMLCFLLFPIFYAMCFWHNTVAKKAAQDAARYLSTEPQSEMRTPASRERSTSTVTRSSSGSKRARTVACRDRKSVV